MDTERLKRGLRTEIEHALSGAASGESANAESLGATGDPSGVVLLMRPRRLPRALVTDARGVTTPKVLDYVELLSTLDGSATVTELAREPVRTHKVPALPTGALLLDVVERPSGASYIVSGATPAREHLFIVEEDKKSTTHLINLPPIAYRAIWDSRSRSLTNLSLALFPPGLGSGPEQAPDAQTELCRWPFSNVYDHFGGALEGVCWPALPSIEMELSEIAEKAVAAFCEAPNDAGHYARDLSRNAPVAGYREFLDAIEKGGGLRHEWLEPCAMTIEDLHEQRRRES